MTVYDKGIAEETSGVAVSNGVACASDVTTGNQDENYIETEQDFTQVTMPILPGLHFLSLVSVDKKDLAAVEHCLLGRYLIVSPTTDRQIIDAVKSHP